MGGNKGDGGRSDAMMDGASSSGGGDGGRCNQVGDCCISPGDCCQGLACDPNAGTCVPCMQTGGSCFGGSNLCCSGNCVGHTCR
jgi:hypothetical protein